MKPGKHNNIICPLCTAKGSSQFKGFKLNSKQGLFPKREYSNALKVYCCRECGLYFNYPFPQTPKEVFKQDDSLMKLTEQDPNRLKAEAGYKDILDFLNKAGLGNGARVLDMGSGIGMAAYAMRQAGFEVYSVEPKHELFDFSVKNHFVDQQYSTNASFETTEFKEEFFDFIFLEPLHHFTNPHEAIQKTLNWLKPGAYLHLEVINSEWLYKKVLALIYKITFRRHVPNTAALRKPYNACEYAPKSFKVYAKKNNLNICLFESYPCNTSIPNKFLSRLMSSYMRLFKHGMELSVILQKKT